MHYGMHIIIHMYVYYWRAGASQPSRMTGNEFSILYTRRMQCIVGERELSVGSKLELLSELCVCHNSRILLRMQLFIRKAIYTHAFVFISSA